MARAQITVMTFRTSSTIHCKPCTTTMHIDHRVQIAAIATVRPHGLLLQLGTTCSFILQVTLPVQQVTDDNSMPFFLPISNS